MLARQRDLAFTCGETDAQTKVNWDKVAEQLREKLKGDENTINVNEIVNGTVSKSSTNFQNLMRELVLHQSKHALPENQFNCLQYVQLYVKPHTNIVCFSPYMITMENALPKIETKIKGAQRRRVLTILYAEENPNDWWDELDLSKVTEDNFWVRYRNLVNNLKSKRTFWKASQETKHKYELRDEMKTELLIKKFNDLNTGKPTKYFFATRTKPELRKAQLQRTMALTQCLIQLELRFIQLEQAGKQLFRDVNISLLNTSSLDKIQQEKS